MTEYTVKEIGHQWIVYADRLRIGTCADEDSALKLIVEDSAANSARRKSMIHGHAKQARPLIPHSSSTSYCVRHPTMPQEETHET
jgi:hypothetical protein